MVEHTKGPWSVEPDHREGMEYNNHVVTGSGDRICFMAHGGPKKQPEFDANARLIAAAPDLYAALRRLLVTQSPDGYEHEAGCRCVIHEARAALARVDAP